MRGLTVRPVPRKAEKGTWLHGEGPRTGCPTVRARTSMGPRPHPAKRTAPERRPMYTQSATNPMGTRCFFPVQLRENGANRSRA